MSDNQRIKITGNSYTQSYTYNSKMNSVNWNPTAWYSTRLCNHRQHGGTLVRMDETTYMCTTCKMLFKLGAMGV